MAVIVYGTHVLTKLAGYYGQRGMSHMWQRQEFEAYAKHIID